MDAKPSDLDASRRTVAAKELIATASGYLTTDVAMQLPFEALGPFKTMLRQFFSPEPWSDDDATRLSDLVAPHVPDGWWEHSLGHGLTLSHGVRAGTYELLVSGGSTSASSVFDLVFSGPVVPEATPHPRKVKFTIGGEASPGVWYRRTDPDAPEDHRVKRLFAEQDITDVMVAGDFVTVGIERTSSWELRLEPLLELVKELFWDPKAEMSAPARTRDELIQEGRDASVAPRPAELHLVNPDDSEERRRLHDGQDSPDARTRRISVAVLAESADEAVRRAAVTRGYADASRVVRRTAIDAAAGTLDEGLRDLFETALDDEDAWIRWKAVRAIDEIGLETSTTPVSALADDPDFQVRFEVARVTKATEA